MPLYSGIENNIYNDKSSIMDPEAPNPPIISGPRQGKLHIRYGYEITSEDPQCDNICYTVITSDLPVIYNSKLCESGYTLIYNHSWDDFYQKEPPYILNARATDCHGHQSEWSSFEISISKNKIIKNTFLENIFTKINYLINKI
jgi:hypothetical protein